MSSRSSSEFGTLGGRLEAMKPKPVERPVDPARHVWVKTPSGRQPGLLVAWVPGAEGKWWGRVAVSDAPGEASLQLLDSSLLTPASTGPEELAAGRKLDERGAGSGVLGEGFALLLDGEGTHTKGATR